MKQYIAYYRVSTAKQGESGLGIESQESIISHFARDGKIVQAFTDIASGKSVEGRTELEKAIQLCIQNKYTLIVSKADRLARNTKEALSIYEKLDGNFVACDCPNTDKFSLTLLFAFAERERELISIRTKSALKAKKMREAKVLEPAFDTLSVSRQEELLHSITINGRAKGVDNSLALRKARTVRDNKTQVESDKYRTTAQMMRDNGCSLREIARQLTALGDSFGKPRKFYAASVLRLLV